jgi:hypothetical protein
MILSHRRTLAISKLATIGLSTPQDVRARLLHRLVRHVAVSVTVDLALGKLLMHCLLTLGGHRSALQV